MITINGDRGFEKIDTWEDIESLPGYTSELDPSTNNLKEIIGRYVFSDRIACGLINCKQPHGRGYLVTTKTGKVTNIGNVCGKTHFGVEFQTLSKQYDRAMMEHNNRESIVTFMFQFEECIDRVSSIRTHAVGADWVNKKAKLFIQQNSGCPAKIVTEIRKMVRSRNNSIAKFHLASQIEVSELEAIENRNIDLPHYIEKQIGKLNGIEVLYPENDLWELIVLDLEKHLNSLAELNIDNSSFKDLKFWAK